MANMQYNRYGLFNSDDEYGKLPVTPLRSIPGALISAKPFSSVDVNSYCLWILLFSFYVFQVANNDSALLFFSHS